MKKHYFILLLTIITINFCLPRLMPGDPFLYLSVEDGNVSVAFSEKQIQEYKAYYGLDQPLHIQFVNYLKSLLKGDLGYSIYYNVKVADMIFSRIPWTLFIVLTSLLVSSMMGVVMGSVSAYFRGNKLDQILYFFMNAFSEIPSFLLGIFLLFIFGAKLKLFPLSGGITPFKEFYSTFGYFLDILHHGALPILTLSLARIGDFYLLARSSMITILSEDYIQTARGKGIKKTRILFYHALRNALPPILARIFMSLGGMFGGAVLVENIFAYPGIGKLMREAVFSRDYILMQGIFLVTAITVLLTNYIADRIYRKLDPRVE